MNRRYGIAIFVFTIFTAIVVAGCTSSDSNTGPTNIPAGITLKSLIDTGNVHWCEYNMTMDTPGASIASMQDFSENMKVNYSVDYNGTVADKYTITTDMSVLNNTSNSITEIYMDHVEHSILGGHIKSTTNGNFTEDDLPVISGMGQGGQDPLLVSGNSTLTSMGTESVTVPAGTYTATKYSWADNGTIGYVWIAPNVPVPVKSERFMQGILLAVELVGYG